MILRNRSEMHQTPAIPTSAKMILLMIAPCPPKIQPTTSKPKIPIAFIDKPFWYISKNWQVKIRHHFLFSQIYVTIILYPISNNREDEWCMVHFILGSAGTGKSTQVLKQICIFKFTNQFQDVFRKINILHGLTINL